MPNNTTNSPIMIHNDKPIGFLLSVTAQSDIQLSATAKAKDVLNQMNQSNTCSRFQKAACEQVTVGFACSSNLMKMSRKIFISESR